MRFLHCDDTRKICITVNLIGVCSPSSLCFSALTSLVWRQEEHLLAYKISDEVLAWLPVWSKVQMICIWSS